MFHFRTEILIFTGNDLGELPMNILGRTDYEDLDLIDLSNNKITFIPGKTFHHVSLNYFEMTSGTSNYENAIYAYS